MEWTAPLTRFFGNPFTLGTPALRKLVGELQARGDFDFENTDDFSLIARCRRCGEVIVCAAGEDADWLRAEVNLHRSTHL